MQLAFSVPPDRVSEETMTVPTHVLGVDLLKLILRSKDPFKPRFYCHSCKQKYNHPMTSTSPRPTKCDLCSSESIEWILPEDPHKRAARLRDAELFSRLRGSPSPPPRAAKAPEKPKDEPMDTAATATAENTETSEDSTKAVQDTPRPAQDDTTEAAKAETVASSSDPPAPGSSDPPAPGAEGGGAEPMEQEPAMDGSLPPEEEPEEGLMGRGNLKERSSGGRLSAQPMVVVSAGGDPECPILTMNLFPSLDEAGPRNEGRRGPIRTTVVQQKTSRNFTYLAQEYMAQIIEGGRGRAGQTRRGQQLLVGLTGGAQTESSDPADFVWGARGLDSIISGLLDSMSDRGPPPAKKDKVDAIPMVIATQEIVDENVDGCTVCKDAFKVDDKLRKLPCKHLFHESCILPWLKQRDTCPTCRFHVNTEKSDAS